MAQHVDTISATDICYWNHRAGYGEERAGSGAASAQRGVALLDQARSHSILPEGP
ncbi:hypothetical protein [Nocardia gipuzkoensis]|uniref:hypothetical protein n=1 Tax=Nocardia gipuzkoensis TaxID=2749991 RepID=UPI00237EBB98|nr:hypothetical protein [Nocardia gipuzkoensis]MDE1675524.1 hypothetical protein [Nocardia gipuzkoensis]